MRSRSWKTAMLAAALVALTTAGAARAQQQAPAGPGNLIEGIGGAIRGFFEAIFGPQPRREGEIPVPEQAPPVAPAPAEPAKEADKAAAPQAAAPPVNPTPSASATQSLHSAIAKGDFPAAVKMIEQGADVESKDPSVGASALHYAVMKGEMPLVGLLLQRGADVNSRTKSGTTPLHTAVLYRRTEIAEYLIDKGADVNAKSASGATPLGLALAANFHTLEDMLRRRGGR